MKIMGKNHRNKNYLIFSNKSVIKFEIEDFA